MGWWNTRYKERPASKNKAARIAWDLLSKDAAHMSPPRAVQMVWYAPEMYAWCARLNDIEGDIECYIDRDVLEIRDRVNNPGKYSEAPNAQEKTT